MNHPERVLRIIESIQSADSEAYAELYAPDAVMHHPLAPEPINGRKSIRESERALFEAFTDIHVAVLSSFSDGNRAAVEVVLRATHSGALELGPGEMLPATFRKIELPAAWFFDYEPGGLIQMERDYFDTSLLMAQLGVAPAQ